MVATAGVGVDAKEAEESVWFNFLFQSRQNLLIYAGLLEDEKKSFKKRLGTY